MPQGPWPAATQRPSWPGSSPTSGRPSNDCGRAQARAPTTFARRRPGTKRSPARRSVGAHAGASGCSAQEGGAHRDLPVRRHQAEDRAPGRPPPTASTPASSSTCRGGSSISTSATTPQTGTIGCQARVGSITSGVQGPAATSTAPAGRRTPAASTPRARAADHPRPGGLALVEARARGVGALGERAGRGRRAHRVARSRAGSPRARGRTAGSTLAQLVRAEQCGRQLRAVARHLGHGRLEHAALAREHQHARRARPAARSSSSSR